MRSSASNPSRLTLSSGSNIPAAATLSIHINFSYPTTSRRIIYQPIQRPDGVIIESPQYKPYSLPAATPNPGFQFQPQAMLLELPRAREHKNIKKARKAARGRNAGGERGLENDMARQCGRGGYNGPF